MAFIDASDANLIPSALLFNEHAESITYLPALPTVALANRWQVPKPLLSGPLQRAMHCWMIG